MINLIQKKMKYMKNQLMKISNFVNKRVKCQENKVTNCKLNNNNNKRNKILNFKN